MIFSKCDFRFTALRVLAITFQIFHRFSRNFAGLLTIVKATEWTSNLGISNIFKKKLSFEVKNFFSKKFNFLKILSRVKYCRWQLFGGSFCSSDICEQTLKISDKSKKDLKSYRENGKCCFLCFFGPWRPPKIFFSNFQNQNSCLSGIWPLETKIRQKK